MSDWKPGEEADYQPDGYPKAIRIKLETKQIEREDGGVWSYHDADCFVRRGLAKEKYLRRPLRAIPTLQDNVARREARQRELIEAHGWTVRGDLLAKTIAVPIGDPHWFDIPALLLTLRWLMTEADTVNFEQWQSGEHAAAWADRVQRILSWVANKQGEFKESKP